MPAAIDAVQVNAGIESANIAVPDAGIESIHRVDTVHAGADSRRRIVELEVVAVDGDVVGIDVDRGAIRDRGAHVLFQAPSTLGVYRGRHRSDESGAVVVTLGGLSGARSAQHEYQYRQRQGVEMEAD